MGNLVQVVMPAWMLIVAMWLVFFGACWVLSKMVNLGVVVITVGLRACRAVH